MKCKFCNQLCNQFAPNSYLWKCSSCLAVFNISNINNVNSITLSHYKSNNDCYHVIIDFLTNETIIEFTKFYENLSLEAYDNLPKSKIIARFKPLVDFNPSNLAQKLQTILTFQ